MRWSAALAGCVVAVMIVGAPEAQAAVPPGQDPFYSYQGTTPLAGIAPGTVLKTRVLSYHVAGLPLPVRAVQLLYRSTGEIGQPTVNVTSRWSWSRTRKASKRISPPGQSTG